MKKAQSLCFLIFFLVCCSDAFGQTASNMSVVTYLGEDDDYEEYDFYPQGQAMAASGDTIYTMGPAPTVFGVWSFSDPVSPQRIGFFRGYIINPESMTVADDQVFIAADDGGLYTVDVSDAANPQVVSVFTGPEPDDGDVDINGVAASENFAYVAAGYQGLRIVNVSDPSTPTEVGSVSHSDIFVWEATISGNYIYTAEENREHTDDVGVMRIIDISDPTNPQEVGLFYSSGLIVTDVAVAGDYAYVANRYNGLRVVDISDPSNPTEVGSVIIEAGVFDLTLKGNYIYVGAHGNGIRTIDISEPTEPEEVGFFDTSEYADFRDPKVGSQGHIYAITRSSGFYVLENNLQTATEESSHKTHRYSDLKQNHPNPFHSATTIQFYLSKPQHVKLQVFDVTGREVATLIDRRTTAGKHKAKFHGRSLPSGIYFYQLQTATSNQTKKLVLTK